MTDDRLRKSALSWMGEEGPLLVDLDGPTEQARAAAHTLMPICRAMAEEGLCHEDKIGDRMSVFAIATDARRMEG